jgi:phytoene dehydrogenase-like protein
MIQSPIVVIGVPVWETFKLISEGLFPEWFVGQVKSLKATTAIAGMYAGFKEPIFEETWFILTYPPRSEYPFVAFMESNVEPSLAPAGEHLFLQISIVDRELGEPENRERLHRFFELAKQDLEEWFPGWENKCLWVKPYWFDFEEPARTPGREGVFRLGPKAPGIDGLYFAGDTVSSRSLAGLNCAADSAGIRVDASLEEKDSWVTT